VIFSGSRLQTTLGFRSSIAGRFGAAVDAVTGRRLLIS
jgi:hypothetical protein